MISALYVDDCRSLLDITCHFLERRGDLVVEVSLSNDDALQKMNYLLFDAIVTDYSRKGSAGIVLFHTFRQRGLTVPFVFFTLERNPATEQELMKN